MDGHCGPSEIIHLLETLRPGGRMIMSAPVDYLSTSEFEDFLTESKCHMTGLARMPFYGVRNQCYVITILKEGNESIA